MAACALRRPLRCMCAVCGNTYVVHSLFEPYLFMPGVHLSGTPSNGNQDFLGASCEDLYDHRCRAACESVCMKHAAAFCTALTKPVTLLS